MPDRILPDHPDILQYKKQAKELVRDCALFSAESLARIHKHLPRLLRPSGSPPATVRLADAQFVLAREHGYDSWPQFAKHIETLRIIRSLETLSDPVNTFIDVASVDRHGWHGSGTLEYAELILARFPTTAVANIYTAAILGDESAIRAFLAADPSLAQAKGGPRNWDALTYLCFSRYLRIDKSRSASFVAAARALLEAGADANTGWTETIDTPPREIPETAIYAAAGIARNPDLTRLLLEFGADPNDEETPYHSPETYDNSVLEILLDSGRFNERSLATVIARKCDWHDDKGLALGLARGANPNFFSAWQFTPFQHSIRRDNGLIMIEMLLDHGADPHLKNNHDGRNAFEMAAHHGRGDILHLLEQRGFASEFSGPDRELDLLIAACARAQFDQAQSLIAGNQSLLDQLLAMGGPLLARFSGVANLEGVRCLLDLGVSASALWPDGDIYWEITKNSTALHVAAWRAHHDVVRELIARGAPINAIDLRGRTALALAVRACIDSYWKYRRKPDSVQALLAAGATIDGIDLPTGYVEIDELLLARQS
jgi:ankyrin repeat protein